MSGSSEQRITCRGCNEEIPTDVDNCPHCGTAVRGKKAPVIMILISVVMIGASIAHLVVNESFELVPFAVLGALVGFVGGYMIYEQRQRLVEVPADGETEAEAEV